MFKTRKIATGRFHRSRGFSALLCSALLLLVNSLYSSMPSPVDINLKANHLGGRKVELIATILGFETYNVKAEIALPRALVPVEANRIFQGELTSTLPAELRTIVKFKEFNAEYPVTVLVIAVCEDCEKPILLGERTLYLVTLDTGPVLLNDSELHDKVYNDAAFREKLGIQMRESKRRPGARGLYHPESGDMEFKKDRSIKNRLLPRIEKKELPAVIKIQTEKKKVKAEQDSPGLASTIVYKGGRVTYYHYGLECDYGIPNVPIYLAVTIMPGYLVEDYEGYTDADGYYSFPFNVPDGKYIDDEGYKAIETYLLNEEKVFSVIDSNDYLFSVIRIDEGSYDVNYNATDPLNFAAQLYENLQYSYNLSSARDLRGDSVTIKFPESTGNRYVDSQELIYIKNRMNSNSLGTVSHEHGHHLMNQNYGWDFPWYTGAGWSGCNKEDSRKAWGEGWACFWQVYVTTINDDYGYGCLPNFEDIDKSPHCTSTGIVRDSVIYNIVNALWDLYDNSGTGDNGMDSYCAGFSHFGDAFRSESGADDTFCEYMERYIDQDSSNEEDILDIISLNVDCSGGTLLAGSALDVSPGAPPMEYEFSSTNYPNPFNPSTTIQFSLPERYENVSLRIFNVRGQAVKTLVDAAREPGTYFIFWDGTDNKGRKVSSGVYFYRLEAGGITLTRKMVLLK